MGATLSPTTDGPTGSSVPPRPGLSAFERLDRLNEAVRRGGAGPCLLRGRLLRQIVAVYEDRTALDAIHANVYVVPKKSLEKLVEDEGYLVETAGLPDPALLVAEPALDELEHVREEALLLRTLALEVHGRVDLLLRPGGARELLPSRAETLAAVLTREALAEARMVLAAESVIDPGAADVVVVRELFAVIAELRALDPTLVTAYFPSLDGTKLERALDDLGLDLRPEALLDARGAELLHETRRAVAVAAAAASARRAGHRRVLVVGARAGIEKLQELAGREAARGNDVRALLLHARTSEVAEAPSVVAEAHAAKRKVLLHLAQRLRSALLDHGPTEEAWAEALAPIVEGLEPLVFTPQAKLLYDLQRACLERERPGLAVDLWAWVRSRGAEPLSRTLSEQVSVRVHRSLRRAADRGRALPHAQHGPLIRMLEEAEELAGSLVRDELRPVLAAALREAGLVPASVPEEVGAAKIVDELIDRILRRDYISFSDLRDELSLQTLKLKDLHTLPELLQGDALLRADRLLGKRLVGVYRGSQVYMRALQRMSSMFFGTPTGRLAARFLLLPWIASYIALEGLSHLLGSAAGLLGLPQPPDVGPMAVLVGALITLLHIEHKSVRAATLHVLRALGSALKLTLYDAPRAVAGRRPVRRLLDTLGLALLRRFLVKPLLPVAVLYVLLPLAGMARHDAVPLLVSVFLGTSLLANSRVGRRLELRLTDLAALGWARVRRRFLPELFRVVMETSARFLRLVERMRYVVDEMTRFREGDRRLAIATKLVFGSLWSGVMYVVQLYVNLLIEPQINPIKHFPVVTVTHKVILPYTKLLITVFAAPLAPFVGPVVAGTLALATVFLLPGLFGFLVWELSANFRLYEATRPPRLGRLRMGPHGETVLHLLRPGFHAGTLPKLMAKRRHKLREALLAGEPAGIAKEAHGLDEVRIAIEDFFERELCALLRREPRFGETLTVRAVRLGAAALTVVVAPTHGEPLRISIREDRGRLVGRVEEGFARSLGSEPRALLGDALLGQLTLCGVEWVEPRDAPALDLARHPVPWPAWRDRFGPAARPDAPSVGGSALLSGGT